jgi:hypothetical protein
MRAVTQFLNEELKAMSAYHDRMQLTLHEETYADVLKNLDPVAEANNRRWAAIMIVDACVILELPRVTCATAQVNDIAAE